MPEPIRDQDRLLREALLPTVDCPPLALLAAPQPADSVKRHLAQCPHCRAELDLLRQFENAEAKPEEAADVEWMKAELARRSPVAAPRGEAPRSTLREWFLALLAPAGRGRLAVAAAALLVVVTAGVFLRPGGGVRTSPPEDGTVWRSGEVAAISPVGELDRAPTQLRWAAVAGAARYHVRLLEVDGTEIWSADSSAATADLPATLAPTLAPGRAFQWDVAALDAAGRKIAAANLQSFHIPATRR